MTSCRCAPAGGIPNALVKQPGGPVSALPRFVNRKCGMVNRPTSTGTSTRFVVNPVANCVYVPTPGPRPLRFAPAGEGPAGSRGRALRRSLMRSRYLTPRPHVPSGRRASPSDLRLPPAPRGTPARSRSARGCPWRAGKILADVAKAFSASESHEEQEGLFDAMTANGRGWTVDLIVQRLRGEAGRR